MTKHLFVGGMVAAGFDPTGQYLLTVSHSERGVFAVGTWERLARDLQLAYPENGLAIGIGPIDGVSIPIREIEHATGKLQFQSPDGEFSFAYKEGTLTVKQEGKLHAGWHAHAFIAGFASSGSLVPISRKCAHRNDFDCHLAKYQ